MTRVGGKMTVEMLEKDSIHDVEAPRPIASEAQYDRYAAVLHSLVMQETRSASARQFIELLTILIEKYDSERHAIESATPAEVLQTLLDANNLKQKDLVPFIGNESVVSLILHGKRPLTTGHIERLSKRFNVSPAVFFS
jgi:HTH-type transcriptional regulator/antitoxin HigA